MEKIVGVVTLLAVAVIASIALEGIALVLLWNWFVAEVFHVRTISIPIAFGLTMVIAMLTHRRIDLEAKKNNTKSRSEAWVNIFSAIVLPPVGAITIGYVVHLFV